MSLFRRAMEREEWEVAALCLLLGTLEAAAKLPRGAVTGLRRVLGTGGPSKGRSRGGRKS
ncbi:MAG: hypothetical protein V3U26_06090 [Dehalococcoidia bacterium]